MEFLLNLFIILADQSMWFFINLMVARNAGEELFGDYTVATNALLLLATLITFGIDSIIAYYVPKLYAKHKFDEIRALNLSIKRFLQPIYTNVFISGLVGAIALIALSKAVLGIGVFEISHPFILVVWGTIALSLYYIDQQYLRAIGYMRMAVLISLFQSVVYFTISLFINFYIYDELLEDEKQYFVHFMLLGYISSFVIMLIVSNPLRRKSILNRNKIQGIEPHQWKSKMYGYTIQNLNKYIFVTIPLITLEWLDPSEYVIGLFSAAVSIVSLGFIGLSPIGILIGPDISAAYAKSKDELRRVVRKYLVICFTISLILAIILAFAAKPILLLYQSKFINALPYTYVSLMNILCFGISMPLSKMIQYSHQGSSLGARLTAFLMSFQLIACIAFIKWFSLAGAVLCYTGINVVYLSIMVYFALKIYRSNQVVADGF